MKQEAIGDQVLQEIWRIKDQLYAARGHDVHRLFADIGLAVGAGIGQQMAQQAGQLVMKLPESGTPPPVMAQFHVVVNGQQAGPFAEQVLKQMVAAGTFTAASLVWRTGMASWQAGKRRPPCRN